MPSPAGRLTRALQHRNFRLFFGGQSISLVGTWITRVATSWLVYRLTGSELLLGVAGFAGQIPTLIITPFAGVLVDRHDRRRILLWTQAGSLVQSALLAVLTFTGIITVKQIIWLQVVQGIINSFDTPARQAFVSEMVEDRRDLPNAIALNSSMVNGTRIIGPSIGGVLIAAFGEGWCFAIDAISYIAVIASIVAMRVRPRAQQEAAEMHLLEELHHGWKYVFHSVPIRSALLLVAIVSTAGTPYTVLMPAIAAQVLHGGPNTLGLLMTGTGVGALLGALYLAQRESVVGLGRIIMWASAVFGIGLVIFSLTTSLWPAFLVLAIAGCGFMIQLAATNTILQTIVEERLRGRVMSFYTMAFFGTVPIGSLLGGIMADHYGATRTVLVSGIICLAGSAWFAYKLPAIRAVIRPIYRERGIITVPAVDTGAKTL
ncbi:MAG TPA: MFS transporter [Vicinamibacterales bacterium]|nr:MFS transporter [Vicinamibacterales bacterium]